MWQVENCLGAMDGKHIRIKAPINTGSYYYNYKGFFSIVLFAVVNANYEFIYAHCGTNGRVSDGGVLKETPFGILLDKQKLNIPSPNSNLRDGSAPLPYTFIGDDAFPLHENLMKPYGHRKLTKEEKIFNYRICRGRRVVENAFGILASKFRCLLTCLEMGVKSVDKIVLACCALHNFLRRRNSNYIIRSLVDDEDLNNGTMTTGQWRNEVSGFHGLQKNKQSSTTSASLIRDTFKAYYNNEGKVDFQDRMVN